MQSTSRSDFKIGLLGGIGARASARFHASLVERCACDPAVAQDEDFPTIVHWSGALAGFGPKGVIDEARLRKSLSDVVQLFRHARVNVLAPVCNSLHPYRQWLEDALGVPVISPVTCAARKVQALGFSSALVLQSRGLAKQGSYARELQAVGVHSVEVPPALQDEVDRCIGELIGGPACRTAPLADLIRKYRPAGAAVVLGCTELVPGPAAPLWPQIDSSETLVETLLTLTKHEHPQRTV